MPSDRCSALRCFFFFSSRRRHTRSLCDWSSDVCSSDLFDPVDTLDTIRTAYQGDVVGQAYDGYRVFDIVVILDPHSRGTVERIGELLLRNPAGINVPLRQIADVYQTSGRYQILHQGAQRVQTITANVTGRDVTSFVADAKAKIASEVKPPAGSYIEFAGAAEAQAQSRRDLIVNALIAGAVMVLLLSFVQGNWRNLLVMLANLPFAFVGGVLAAFATGGLLSLGSMVGFVTLFGITLRNSIMMISHYEHLVSVDGRSLGFATAIEGAADGLVPT